MGLFLFLSLRLRVCVCVCVFVPAVSKGWLATLPDFVIEMYKYSEPEIVSSNVILLHPLALTGAVLNYHTSSDLNKSPWSAATPAAQGALPLKFPKGNPQCFSPHQGQQGWGHKASLGGTKCLTRSSSPADSGSNQGY